MERDFTNVWLTLGLVVIIGGSISYWTFSQKQNVPDNTAEAELTAVETISENEPEDDLLATEAPQTASQPAQTAVPATTALKIFLGKEGDSPSATECSHPVTRTVPFTSAVGRASLVELFKGPTTSEIQQGYFSCFVHTDIDVKGLRIENGTAIVNLSKEYGEGCGSAASCSAQAQSAVTNTLKQFPTVKSVQIQIEGVTQAVVEST